jgi:Glycosyltransferase family 87
VKGPSQGVAQTPPDSAESSTAHPVRRRLFIGDPIIAVFVLLAVGIDALQLSRPGYLFGLTSDISDYLGASVRLVSGYLPYRDFVFLQPPGIVVILSPFAFIAHLVGTRGALAILRLSTLVVAGSNVLLVGRLVRHKGRLVTLAACAVMALYPAERYALNAGLLEPLTNLFCLAGASLVFDRDGLASRRRMLLGGALFGVACAVKGPAIVPVVVVAVVAATSSRQRVLPFTGGVAASLGALSLPFLALAPTALVHDVVATQLARIPGASRASVITRLQEMTFGGGRTGAYIAAGVIAVIIVAALLIAPRRPPPLEVFGLATLVTITAVQFATTQYYPQYPAFLAPFLAIVLGTALGRFASWHGRRIAWGVAVAGICVLLFGQIGSVEARSTPDVRNAVDSVVPAGACALADRPEFLVTADRFVSAMPGCTEMVDPFGTFLAFTHDHSGGVATFRTAILHADYLVLGVDVSRWFGGPYAVLRGYVGDHFHVVAVAPLHIYVRDGLPPP